MQQPSRYDRESGRCYLARDFNQYWTNLEIVWAHEEVGNTGAHDAHDPLVEVGRLTLGHGVLDFGLNKASQALDLEMGRQYKWGAVLEMMCEKL